MGPAAQGSVVRARLNLQTQLSSWSEWLPNPDLLTLPSASLCLLMAAATAPPVHSPLSRARDGAPLSNSQVHLLAPLHANHRGLEARHLPWASCPPNLPLLTLATSPSRGLLVST